MLTLPLRASTLDWLIERVSHRAIRRELTRCQVQIRSADWHSVQLGGFDELEASTRHCALGHWEFPLPELHLGEAKTRSETHLGVPLVALKSRLLGASTDGLGVSGQLRRNGRT